MSSISNYATKKKLGSGKQGTVFLVEHKKTKKEFALKRILCQDLNEASQVLKETFLLKNLQHEGLIETIDGFLDKTEDDEIFFYTVMNYYKNGDLSGELKRKREDNSFFKEIELVDFFNQLASCVNAMHNFDLIHRDLKPENILLSDDMKYLIICDFGRLKKYEIDISMSLAGTIHYVAPEVMNGEKYNQSVDIFSLGCVFLEMTTLSKQILYIQLLQNEKKVYKELKQQIKVLGYSSKLCDLIIQMIQLKPNNRITSEELNQKLKVLLKLEKEKEENMFQIPNTIPGDVVGLILQYSSDSIYQLFQYGFVSKDWMNHSIRIRQLLKNRYFVSGCHVIDKHSCKIVKILPEVSEEWTDGMNFHQFNYLHCQQDSECFYYIKKVKKLDKKKVHDLLLKHHSELIIFPDDTKMNQDSFFIWELHCKEIGSSFCRWYIPLPCCIKGSTSGERFSLKTNLFQDSKFIFVVLERRIYGFRKCDGKPFFIHKSSRGLNAFCTTPNYLLIDERSVTMTHSLIFKKPQDLKSKFNLIQVKDFNGYVSNTNPTFYGYENQWMKRYHIDYLFTELRFPNALYNSLDVFEIKDTGVILRNSFKIQSDNPMQINHACMGVHHWIFSGNASLERRVYICNMISGEMIIPEDKQAYHMCESDDGNLIGSCSACEGRLTFYPKNELKKDKNQKYLWMIDFVDLEKFNYYPLFTFKIIDENLICLMYGGKGVYLYSIKLKNGNLDWSLKLSKEDEQFNHFDVGCTMKYFDGLIFTIVCVRGIGFSYCMIDSKSGSHLIQYSCEWSQWAIDKETLIQSQQVHELESKKNCVIS
eukprot:gene8556-379_t